MKDVYSIILRSVTCKEYKSEGIVDTQRRSKENDERFINDGYTGLVKVEITVRSWYRFLIEMLFIKDKTDWCFAHRWNDYVSRQSST